jgi:hypothetical protein
MTRSSNRLAGRPAGAVSPVPKRDAPARQASRKRAAKVPRLSELNNDELMNGAAMSLSTLVQRVGYEAVVAALNVHKPASAATGVDSSLGAAAAVPVVALPDVAALVPPKPVSALPLPVAPVPPALTIPDSPTAGPSNALPPTQPFPSGPPGSTAAAAEALVRAVVPLLGSLHSVAPDTHTVHVHPPKAYGRVCLLEKRSAQLFLDDVESFAKYSRADPIKLLASFLQDNVRVYWANVMTLWANDIAEGSRGPVTWKEVVTTFTAYVGEDAREFRRQSLALMSGNGKVRLAQRDTESVQDYTRRYQECLAYLQPGDVSETLKLHTYINNLLPRFRFAAFNYVQSRDKTSLAQLIDHVRSAEHSEIQAAQSRAAPSPMHQAARVSCAVAQAARFPPPPRSQAQHARGSSYPQHHHQARSSSHHQERPPRDQERPPVPAELAPHLAHYPEPHTKPYEDRLRHAATTLIDLTDRKVLDNLHLCYGCGGNHKRSDCRRRSAFLAYFGVGYEALQREVRTLRPPPPPRQA